MLRSDDQQGPGTVEMTEDEFLAGYDPRQFPLFAVTVDIVVMTVQQGRLAVLLVERTEHPQRGAWALPGGFVGEAEDLLAAAACTLGRETGLRALPHGTHLEQLATYGRPDRDPRLRVVSVAYLALAPAVALPRVRAAGPGVGRVRLWPVEDLRGDDAPPLAFDHAAIVRDGVERARAKLEYTTIALAFVPEPFTLADLRRVYEAVWGGPLDPSNFRRKVLETPGFVVPLDGAPRREAGAGRGRPADLYRKGETFWLDRTIRRPRVEQEPGQPDQGRHEGEPK